MDNLHPLACNLLVCGPNSILCSASQVTSPPASLSFSSHVTDIPRYLKKKRDLIEKSRDNSSFSLNLSRDEEHGSILLSWSRPKGSEGKSEK